MALQYYILDETPSRMDLVNHKGAAESLFFLPGLGWASQAMANDFYAGVNSWRSGDQINWYNQYSYQAKNVMDAIVGEAFFDTMDEYVGLPSFATTTQAWKNYGIVFIPYGATDPRSQEVLPDEEEDVLPDDEPPSWQDDIVDDDDLESLPPEPSAFSSVLRIGIALAAGGLAGGITWYYMPD